MENKRIDFEELKRKISIEDIIQHFQLDLKEVKPNVFRGNCPFKNHEGDRNSRSFNVNSNGLYICPTHCGGGTGIIDFYCGLMGYDKTRDSYRAAISLQNLFCNEIANCTERVIKEELIKEKKENPICKIRLDIDHRVDYLLKTKKLDLKTLQYFGLGVAKYGVLQGKVAIPVHNKNGELVGYAGQDIDTGKWSVWFSKSLVVFNYHRVKALKNLKQVILVEGYYSCLFLHKCGFRNTVAVLGVWVSDTQIKLLKELSDTFLIFFDNDRAGIHGAEVLSKKLRNEGLNFQVVKGLGKQKPLDYSIKELNKILVQDG